jgi:hypothetical protein
VSAIVLRQDGHARLVEHNWASSGYRGQYQGSAYYFVSGDARFDYEFTDYADSVEPVAVWSFNGVGHLVDVTRKRLDLVRANAQRLHAGYVSDRARPDSDVRGVLAAWCADEYMLGDGDTCDSELQNALQTGLLQRPTLVFGPTGQAFVSLLRKDLLRWGYSR